MQINYDESKYKNFNFFNSQISKPWVNNYGTEMVCIALPNYVKEYLKIPTNTRAVFNVSKERVYRSKFNSEMSYTRVSLDRDMNIYISHKDDMGNYTNNLKTIKGRELYDALKARTTKSKDSNNYSDYPNYSNQPNQPINSYDYNSKGSRSYNPNVPNGQSVQYNNQPIGQFQAFYNSPFEQNANNGVNNFEGFDSYENVENNENNQSLQDIHNEIEKENEQKSDMESLEEQIARQFDEIDDIQF